MQLPNSPMLLSINAPLSTLNGDGEDGMRTGTVRVHVGGPDRSWRGGNESNGRQ